MTQSRTNESRVFADPMEMQAALKEFRAQLIQFRGYLNSPHFTPSSRLEPSRHALQVLEPRVSHITDLVLGEDERAHIRRALLIPHDEHELVGSYPLAMERVNRAIGALEDGLWPPKVSSPTLIIADRELRDRCEDLLKAPGHYDRVVLVATTVLEDRLRRHVPHEVLSSLIPHSKDQTGDRLVNVLFAPDKSVLSISQEHSKRVAFHRMLLAAVSLRNQYHHQLDDATEWSWAWSTVGFIDHLLADLTSCILIRPKVPE